MSRLVPYIRNSDGKIERVADGMYSTESNLTAPYLREESLVGFLESKVYWAKKFPPRLGVAPYYGHLETPSYQIHAAQRQSCHQVGKNSSGRARISITMHALAFLRRKRENGSVIPVL